MVPCDPQLGSTLPTRPAGVCFSTCLVREGHFDSRRRVNSTVRRQVRESMRKIKSIVSCWLLFLTLCLTESYGQKRVQYPKNADDIIAFVGVFSQLDLS